MKLASLSLLLLALAANRTAETSEAPEGGRHANASATRQAAGALGYTALGEPGRFRLPNWFSYDLYRRFYGKKHAEAGEHEARKRIYLRTALRVFEQRALYRAGRVGALPSVNELSDLTADELAAVRSRRTRVARADWRSVRADCCSLAQVYARVIALLNSTELNGAYVAELEQRPLVESDVGELEEEEENVAATKAISKAGQAELSEPRLANNSRSASGRDQSAIEARVEKQLIDQLNGDSLISRQLTSQLSALFGEPVKLRASLATATKDAQLMGSRTLRPPDVSEKAATMAS